MASARDTLDLETWLAVMRAGSPKERAEARQAGFESELQAEMAGAFGRANEKVQRALADLGRALATLDGASDTVRPEALERAQEAWTAASRARWELRVHREAIGLRWTREVDERFPLPPRPRD